MKKVKQLWLKPSVYEQAHQCQLVVEAEDGTFYDVWSTGQAGPGDVLLDRNLKYTPENAEVIKD